MRLQLMCCALSNLLSSQFTEGRIKRDKEELKGTGGKRLKSIFELANTSSNYRLYTKYCGGVRSLDSRVPEFRIPGYNIVQGGRWPVGCASWLCEVVG